MMTQPARIRALVDKLNKQKAARPAMPFNDNRQSAELANTSANARQLAAMNVKKQKPMSVANLIRRGK